MFIAIDSVFIIAFDIMQDIRSQILHWTHHRLYAWTCFVSQVSKQGMSNRVVDELNPDMLLTRKDLAVLLDYKDEEAPPPDTR